MQSHGSVMTAASLESFPSTLMRLSLSFHVFSLCYKLRSLNGLADSLAKQGVGRKDPWEVFLQSFFSRVCLLYQGSCTLFSL